MYQNYRVLFLNSGSKIIVETYYRSNTLLDAVKWAANNLPFPDSATVIEVSAAEANTREG